MKIIVSIEKTKSRTDDKFDLVNSNLGGGVGELELGGNNDSRETALDLLAQVQEHRISVPLSLGHSFGECASGLVLLKQIDR